MQGIGGCMRNRLAVFLTAILASLALPAAAQVVVSTPSAFVPEEYRADNSRDPMIPSNIYGDVTGTGELRLKSDAAMASVEKGTFTIYRLTLTGILVDSRGRQALFRDDAGNMYTLIAGGLKDSTNKKVPGVSGAVKGKQVTLMTVDKEVHQLTLVKKE